jgi:hypothetical protein
MLRFKCSPLNPVQLFCLSLNPFPRGEGLKSLTYYRLPPSLLGEGGKGDEVKNNRG